MDASEGNCFKGGCRVTGEFFQDRFFLLFTLFLLFFKIRICDAYTACHNHVPKKEWRYKG
jgi:hypothetical protein